MGLLAPFVRELRRHDVALVGPAHMKRLDDRVLDPARHIKVPDSTAWEYAEAVTERVYAAINGGCDLVLFSAGQGSCLMIHALWGDPYVRANATLIDTGSMWDPYCNVNSRRVYTTPEWQAIKERNIP